jgi:hypothetical protein
MVQTRQQKKTQQNNLISATRISNSVKNDKLLDYLDLLNEKGLTISENLTIGRKRSFSKKYESLENSDKSHDSNYLIKSNKKKKTSFDYIVEAGYLFESDIINKIKHMMELKGELNKLIDIGEKDININCSKTIQVIKKNKHSIILGSVLINSSNNTWGKPDLIVKGCWIEKYIQEKITGFDVNKWYIIDIKSSTIQLINGGEDISSKLLYTVYKSQIYVYTQALNYLLNENRINNNVSLGFVLGKKYKYVLNKNQIVKNSFDSIGVIDFDKEKIKGIDWKNIIISSIEWIKDLRTNWEKFSINPINRDELYPNMKNTYNKNWYGIKKNVAQVNKELSSLWYCGLTNRDRAWAKGIKSYMDKNLSPEILGFDKSDSKYNIINTMLKLLHSKDKKFILDKKNNFMNWQQKTRWEFFVDFETFNSEEIIYDETNDWDNLYNGCQQIYMCGISWIGLDEKFNHRTFIICYPNIAGLLNEFDKNKLSSSNDENHIKWEECIFCSSELDLLTSIKNFILEFKPGNMNVKKFYNNTRLIHWSCAEPVLFNKKIKEYGLNDDDYKLNWYDLLNVFKFKSYPIIIKECFGFGLKNVVRKLNEYGEINIQWSDLDDGLLSSFIARDIYTTIPNSSTNNDDDFMSNKNMYDIIKYNLIDCKAILVLINWMRKCID